jgi:hypothetical protein
MKTSLSLQPPLEKLIRHIKHNPSILKLPGLSLQPPLEKLIKNIKHNLNTLKLPGLSLQTLLKKLIRHIKHNPNTLKLTRDRCNPQDNPRKPINSRHSLDKPQGTTDMISPLEDSEVEWEEGLEEWGEG